MKKIIKDIHRFLERRLGRWLPWVIYGVTPAILIRVLVFGQSAGEILADLTILAVIIGIIVAALKILQRRTKRLTPRR